ncbi:MULTISPECIES: class II aldolase/adducin family protein [Anaerotruncus]|nr:MULTISPECIES: class II aldolase/adducin family protein [Anaerotruncus]MCR2024569.1 class II aldolase/adducin family protein [Anaerotruncus colihominis]
MGNHLSYIKERTEMLEIVHHMFDRRLTNAAGGNIAVQVDDGKLLVSPSMMSEDHRCNIAVEDFLLIDFDKNILEGEGNISRESDMHIGLLKNFAYIRACIHAHPQYCMVYASQSKPIPSVTEATMQKGDCGAIPYTRAYTPELAQNIYKYFDGMRDKSEQMPLGVVIPLHGVLCTGSNLTTAYCMLERLETDAMCGIFKNLI